MNQTSKLPAEAALTPVQEIIESERAKWTSQRQAAFLRALASTHCVAKAARAAGMSRSSAYKLRARLKGEAFDLAWEAALTCRLDTLADVAIERAFNGVEVPHFYKGELIHISRKFDEKLTIELLRMRERRRPTYLPQTHPASAYTPDGLGSELGSLLRRIEHGLERWDDEWP
ncbi:MAG: hypothetical protein AAGI28_13425 [Pseudomonadota bacterium]